MQVWHMASMWPIPKLGICCSHTPWSCSKTKRTIWSIVPLGYLGFTGQSNWLVYCITVTGCIGRSKAFYPWVLNSFIKSWLCKRVMGDSSSPFLLSVVSHILSGLLFCLFVHAAAKKMVVGFLLEFILQADLILLLLVLWGGSKPGFLHRTHPESL